MQKWLVLHVSITNFSHSNKLIFWTGIKNFYILASLTFWAVWFEKNFFINNISRKTKNSVQKNKIKNVYWSITAKMTTSTQFTMQLISIPHRYKRTLRVHLTSNWPQIFIRFPKGVEVLTTGSFAAIAPSIYRLRHQTRKKGAKTSKKKKKRWQGHG